MINLNSFFVLDSCPAKIAHRILFSIILFTIIFLTCACSEKEQNRPPADVPVKAAVAVQKDVPEEIATIGTVEAFSNVSLTSRVDGQVMKIHIQEGQQVDQDQMLINIDDRPYQAMLESARSNLERDKIRREKAKIDSKRYADLLQKDYVTKTQTEQAQADAEAMDAVVKGDEAAVENARLNVAYCRITSPISGRAGAILVHEGNLVKANDNTQPLMVINQIQPVYVRFSVPEQRLPDIQNLMMSQDLKVLASPPGSKDNPKEGRITFLDNAINPNTGTIDLKAVFENKDNGLWPGQFVNVSLILGIKLQAVVVPSAAIQMGQQGSFIFVVKDDLTVEIRNVTTGTTINHESVIEEGITVGEQVVIDGQLRLFPGAKVIVKNDTQPGETGNK